MFIKASKTVKKNKKRRSKKSRKEERKKQKRRNNIKILKKGQGKWLIKVLKNKK